MKYLYKFIFDTGKVLFTHANTKKRAINAICEEYGISKEWVENHCRILNMGAD